MKYAFLDLETTGLKSEKDSILEISYILEDENYQKISECDHVVFPIKTPLTSEVTQITGITEEIVKENGIDFEEIRNKVNEELQDTIIIGHNIGFDIAFLRENGIEIDPKNYIDTHQLARILLFGEESYALEILSDKYKFTHTDAHRAMSDVIASRELYFLLLDKIKELPTEFLETIKTKLFNKTDWFTKILFENEKGLPNKKELQKKETTSTTEPVSNIDTPDLSNITEKETLFIKQGTALKTTALWKKIAEKQSSEQPVLIVTPRLEFFSEYKEVPMPETIIAPQKLNDFLEQETKFTDEKLVFGLKCLLRTYYNLQEKNDFDLFFMERDWWNMVHIDENTNELFNKTIENLKEEKILRLTPQAFFFFLKQKTFLGRFIIIDEGEKFAENLLFSNANIISLYPFLGNKETEIQTQFWISHFCKEIIEPKIQRTMSNFPEKLLLPPNASFEKFTESLQEISPNNETLSKLTNILNTPIPTQSRWVEYFPESGTMSFGSWKIDEWKNLKDELSNYKKIIGHYHRTSESNSFFRVFTSCTKGQFISLPEILPSATFTIPQSLVSSNSPEVNLFLAEKIEEIAKEKITETEFVAMNFSSLESLKKVSKKIAETLPDNISLLGEKINGGNGKVVQKLQNLKKVLFLEQRISSPLLSKMPFTTLVIQKFPFNPPHPLLKDLEEKMKVSNINFWDIWTVPMIIANTKRRIAIYENLKEIIWLDSRENSKWGKNILNEIKNF